MIFNKLHLLRGRKGIEAEDFALVDQMGQLLAAAVVKTARPIKTAAPEKPSIQATGEEIGGAERIMERHRIHLYRMPEMWRDKP